MVLIRLLFLLLIILVSACSNDKEHKSQENKQHMFSDKKSVLDKSKQVEKLIQDSFNHRSKNIDEQTK